MGQMPLLDAYQLSERYSRERGRVFLTGTQAIVRIALDQARRDRASGPNTAGFISGYRGSPLGMYDNALWTAKRYLKENNIHFQPGLNEDLAATSVWGSQQVNLFPGATVDGVFSIWYGKGPGVDRAADALKHGHTYGSSALGGVLVVLGDDLDALTAALPPEYGQQFVHRWEQVLRAARGTTFLLSATRASAAGLVLAT